MSLTDEQISQVLNAADVDPNQFLMIMNMAGLEGTGDAIADVRALAALWDVDEEGLLYGLFVEDSPTFEDDAWDAPLTSGWDDEQEDAW